MKLVVAMSEARPDLRLNIAGVRCPECCKPGTMAGVRPKGSKGKCPTCNGKLWVKGHAP